MDLVEVATDQYVVNFRFGRRGSALRDGTKTPLPLSLEKARSVFNALVAEKTKGDPIASAIGFANYVFMVDPERGAELATSNGVPDGAVRPAQAFRRARRRNDASATALSNPVRAKS